MGKIVWVGPRESDKEYTGDFFAGSVTLYGGRKKENKSFCLTKDFRINHNNITDEQTDFMVENEMKIIKQEPDVKFMSYNPNLVYDCGDEILKHFVCVNDENIMKFLDSKGNFRSFAEKYVHTLHSEMVKGNECTFNALNRTFGKHHSWIIQSNIASGGYRTFILNEENEKEVLQSIDKNNEFLVSPFYEKNIPINIHAIIYEEEILLTPGSVQIMKVDQNRILYRGADYIAYRDIKKEIREQFEKEIFILCREIQKLGYRGVIGIDAIIVDNIAWILEANNRFQASTILINKALEEKSMPSIHELNYEAFHKKKSSLIKSDELQKMQVNYSVYAYLEDDPIYHVHNILEKYNQESHIVSFIDDGYISWQEAEKEAYFFKIIFDTNVVSIGNDEFVRIHPNVEAPLQSWDEAIFKKADRKKLKIALLNQGVILDAAVKEYLWKHGGMQEGVYFAVDLTIDNQFVVNSPLAVKFANLSPFKVIIDNEKLYLNYYNQIICRVDISFLDDISMKYTSSGVPVNRMCLLATDRLRIQNSDFCTFKENDIPCKFCEAKYKDISFNIQDICEAIDFYFEDSPKFRHILIGGLSNTCGKEKKIICDIIDHIRAKSDMPIYLMILPCNNVEDIDEYVRRGVTEIGFNLEIFNRNLARKYMPGKGTISLERYDKSLSRAVKLLGKKGAVRSAFVVGLESRESLLEGVEHVCKLGVAPIFSVFRPIPYTEMQDIIPPSNEFLYEMYIEAEKICDKYGLKPGPDCVACQNNTLAFDLFRGKEK